MYVLIESGNFRDGNKQRNPPSVLSLPNEPQWLARAEPFLSHEPGASFKHKPRARNSVNHMSGRNTAPQCSDWKVQDWKEERPRHSDRILTCQVVAHTRISEIKQDTVSRLKFLTKHSSWH